MKILILLLFGIIIKNSYCFQCYVCDSQLDKRCLDTFEKHDNHPNTREFLQVNYYYYLF